MNRKFLLLTCMRWLSCSAALAADPLVAFPQGDFTCAVEVIPHNTHKPDPAYPGRRYSPVIKRITIAQIGGIRRDITLWSDNSVSQLWNIVDKGISLFENDASSEDVIVLVGDVRDQASPKLLHFDAASVSWMTEKSLDKLSETSGGLLHYQADVVTSPPGVVPVATALYQAWIDSKTLLPAKFDDGSALYVLTFSKDSPSGPLVMPTNIQAEYNHWLAVSGPHPHL